MVKLLLTAQHLRFNYLPGKTVLHDISMHVSEGEILYVLGKNGGGKTTLLSCMAGILKPVSGQIFLDRQALDTYTSQERARLIGLIPQMHISAFAYTVGDMVMMGRAPHLNWLATPSKTDKMAVEEALEMVGIFELKDRPYTEISGGERQLVLIARGLAQKCKVLLMDEPTAHLDLSNQHRVLEIVQQLSRQGLSFVISSHAANDALAYADNVLLLSEGWVIEYGPPSKTLTESLLSEVYGIRTEVIFQSENGILTPKAVVPRRPPQMTPESLYHPESPLSQIFEVGKAEPQIIILTGLSGAGKTTWCARLSKIAQELGINVAGIFSPGVFKNGRKVAINIRNIQSGEERHLAKLRAIDSPELSTPRWSFEPGSIAWANHILRDILKSELVIIDELGPLELLRGEGLTAGLSLIDSGNYQVACIVIRSSLVPKALQRWPKAIVISGQLDS